MRVWSGRLDSVRESDCFKFLIILTLSIPLTGFKKENSYGAIFTFLVILIT